MKDGVERLADRDRPHDQYGRDRAVDGAPSVGVASAHGGDADRVKPSEQTQYRCRHESYSTAARQRPGPDPLDDLINENSRRMPNNISRTMRGTCVARPATSA